MSADFPEDEVEWFQSHRNRVTGVIHCFPINCMVAWRRSYQSTCQLDLERFLYGPILRWRAIGSQQLQSEGEAIFFSDIIPNKFPMSILPRLKHIKIHCSNESHEACVCVCVYICEWIVFEFVIWAIGRHQKSRGKEKSRDDIKSVSLFRKFSKISKSINCPPQQSFRYIL